jgi:hypothetical protein
VQSVRNFTPRNFPRILVTGGDGVGVRKSWKNVSLIGFKLFSRCTLLNFPAAEKLPINSEADRTKLNRFKKKKKENNRDPAFSSHVGFVDNTEGDFRLGLFSCSFSPQISRLTWKTSGVGWCTTSISIFPFPSFKLPSIFDSDFYRTQRENVLVGTELRWSMKIVFVMENLCENYRFSSWISFAFSHNFFSSRCAWLWKKRKGKSFPRNFFLFFAFPCYFRFYFHNWLPSDTKTRVFLFAKRRKRLAKGKVTDRWIDSLKTDGNEISMVYDKKTRHWSAFDWHLVDLFQFSQLHFSDIDFLPPKNSMSSQHATSAAALSSALYNFSCLWILSICLGKQPEGCGIENFNDFFAW